MCMGKRAKSNGKQAPVVFFGGGGGGGFFTGMIMIHHILFHQSVGFMEKESITLMI